MKAPEWLDGTVRAFGRQMGLEAFTLGERGVAGLEFENGAKFRLEYAGEALTASVAVKCELDAAGAARLLEAAAPGGRGAVRVRAAYFERTSEAAFAVRTPERAVTVTLLEAVFRELWAAAEKFGRMTA